MSPTARLLKASALGKCCQWFHRTKCPWPWCAAMQRCSGVARNPMSIRLSEMSTPFSQELFQQLPIVGILRGLSATSLRSVVEAVCDGGLTNLEITMNTPGAAEQIQVAREIAGSALNIGAGTVTDLRLLEDALSAGASFIVTPTVAVPVIERCGQLKVPVFPGAFSPTEIARAWELGATMVKLFPADVPGPAYM